MGRSPHENARSGPSHALKAARPLYLPNTQMTDLATLDDQPLQIRRIELHGGDYSLDASSRHRLIVHQGPPTVITSVTAWQRLERVSQRHGDADFIPAGAWAQWRDEGPASVIAITLSPGIILEAARRMGLSARRLDLRPALQVRERRLSALAEMAAIEAEPLTVSESVWRHGLALALSAEIIRVARIQETVPSRPLGAGRLRAVTAYIDSRLDERLTLEDMARQAKLGRSQFASSFRLATGTSPRQYLIRKRVERAHELLLSTTDPISEIALRCGFAHQSHLARAMRKLMGLTPCDVIRSGKPETLRRRLSA